MDTILRPAAPNVWEVVATHGAVLGALEQRPEGFVIVPSMGSPLADLNTPPFASLEAARAGIAASREAKKERYRLWAGGTIFHCPARNERGIRYSERSVPSRKERMPLNWMLINWR
jgi:hypothetical protein